MTDVPMIETRINGKWSLLLPAHRAARPEWETGWERERLDSMAEHLYRLVLPDCAVCRFKLRSATPCPECDGNTFTPRDPRPLIIDVGVEEGDLTALYSQWGCDVVMVEPNPRVWPNVKAIFEANQLRLPVAYWCGFAAEANDPRPEDHIGWLNEHVGNDPGWPLCAWGPVIGDHAFLHLAQHPHVPTITLDTMMGPTHVDAITMDVEGSELRVLRGAERILTRDRPLVWVSVHTDDQWMAENYAQDDRVAVCGYMDSLGYESTLLAIDHEEHWFFKPALGYDGLDVGPGNPATGKAWGAGA